MWLILPILLVVLTLVASALVFYLQYSHSPERRWRVGAQAAHAAASAEVLRAQKELDAAEAEHEAAVRDARQRAYYALLSGIGVEELDHFPGIGPATVASLRNAGFANLAGLQNARIRIYGLGDKRLADIAKAVNSLTAKAGQKFERGECPQARELPQQLQALELRRREREASALARLGAAERVCKQLAEILERTRQITFLRYLRGRFQEQPAIPETQLELPDLEAALRSAEVSAHVKRAPVEPPPVAVPPRPPIRSRPVERPVPARAPTERFVDVPSPTWTPVPRSASVPLLVATAVPPAAQVDRAGQILELTVQFLYAVARRDGRVADAERLLIAEHFERRYQHNQAIFNRARALCAHYESAAIDLDRCLGEIDESFSPMHKATMVQVAYQVAEASGGINVREASLLEKICQRLSVAAPTRLAAPPPTPPVAREPARPARPEPVGPRAVLEIQPDWQLTVELIRRQYHFLLTRYEPGRVQGMGADFIAMAETKRVAIREAALALLRPFGAELEPPAEPPPPKDLRHNPDLDALFG